jgi:hypothetical protein
MQFSPALTEGGFLWYETGKEFLYELINSSTSLVELIVINYNFKVFKSLLLY